MSCFITNGQRESREHDECFPVRWIRVFRRYIFIANWVRNCQSYEKRKVLVRIPHHRQIIPDKDYPLTEESTDLNLELQGKFDELCLSFFAKETLELVSFFTRHFFKRNNDQFVNSHFFFLSTNLWAESIGCMRSSLAVFKLKHLIIYKNIFIFVPVKDVTSV